MAKNFSFEIQNCITITVNNKESREQARDWLVNNLDLYADRILDASCYVSNGEEI